MRRFVLVSGLGFLIGAAPAGAAYAPQLSARLDPSTPSTPAALTLTLRQQPGESANRTEVVRFPPVFRFNPAFAVVGCSPADENAGACPDTSRIGQASADTQLGQFAGPVFLTQDFRVVIFLHGFAGLVQQKVEGTMRVAPDGWVESVLDNLPPVASTAGEIRLEPGARSLVLTPDRCGSYTIDGRFVSHNGETAASRAAVTISGCESQPQIDLLRARGRRGRILVSWVLTDAGSRTAIDLDRRVTARPFLRWRRVRSVSAPAPEGAGHVSLGAPQGRRLGAGRYRVTLTTFGSQGRPADIRRTEVTVPR